MAINERDEAERNLMDLKAVLDAKSKEEDSYIKGLKQALIDTDPEKAFKVLRESQAALNMKSSEINNMNFNNRSEVQSMARSIALDCQSKFIPVMLMENLANAGRESLTMSKVVNLNVDKVIKENPRLMMNQDVYRSDQQSNLDSTTREFEELLKYDSHKKEKIKDPKIPTPKAKPKTDSHFNKKDRAQNDAHSRHKSRGSDIDSEEVIRNLDQMMNDYLKRKN